MLASALWFTGSAAESFVSTTDVVSQGIVATIIVLVFAFLVVETAHRVLVVFSAAALLLAISYLTPYRLISFEAAGRSLDLNVLFLLAGMMAFVGVLKTTGVFPWAVHRLLSRARGRTIIIQALIIWFTGLVSALADNVTTVIFLTPMAIEIARRTGVRPMVYLLPMIMAANIGGAATLIGDPPNILIASGADLLFMDFVRDLTVPILIMMLMLEWFSRRYYIQDLENPTATTAAEGPPPEIQDRTLLAWSLGVGVIVFAGFATHGITHMPVAVPAIVGAAVLLVAQDLLYLRRHHPTHSEREHGLLQVIEKEIEWPTLSFFAFLFIAVGAAVETGLIGSLAKGLVAFVRFGETTLSLSPAGSMVFAALAICWAAGVFSALVDNIPFVAVAIPIVARLAGEMPGDPIILWWALALGACLGGNGSPIGASANVMVIGLAERTGSAIGFREFLRMGVPVTAMTLAAASLFLAGYGYLGTRGVLQVGLAVLAGLTVWRAFAATRPPFVPQR